MAYVYQRLQPQRRLSREAVSIIAYNAVTLSGFGMGVLLGWVMWG